jgi:ribose-phosphate pyrophosphokinase
MVFYKCAILADPEGKAWDLACKIHEKLKKKADKFELNKVRFQRFRDGEEKVKIENNVRKRVCFYIHDSNKPPLEWFTELCLVNHTLRNSSAQEIVDVLPYLKFSRQDRKDESRVPISARVVADVIEKYADRVLTLDVHNPSIQGFYNIPFDNLYSFPTVVKYLRENEPELIKNITVMSADTGGFARAKAFAQRLGTEKVVMGYKTREKPGEVASLKILGSVNGENVLLIDDILDSGNTLVSAATEARNQGAKKVYAYCTHGIFTLGTEKVESICDKVFIGDTIKRKENQIQTISFVDLFSEAIYRISKGESLSALFE